MTFDPKKFLAETEEISSGFDPKKFLEETEEYEEDYEDAEASKLESLAKGAVQGSTMGFSDELGAAALSPIAAAMSSSEGSPDDVDQQLLDQGFTGDLKGHQGLLDKYEQLRDTTRSSNKEAQEANPYTYLGGELLGGMAPAIASGGASATANVLNPLAKKGLGKLALTGAGYGGAYGLGMSEEDTLAGLAGDTVQGGLLGAATGVALPAIGKKLKPLATKVGGKLKAGATKIVDEVTGVPIIAEGLEAIKIGAKGLSVLGKKAHDRIIKESKDLVTGDLKPFLVGENSKFSNAIGKVMKRVNKLGNTKDSSKELGGIYRQLEELNKQAPTEEAAAVINNLMKTLDLHKREILKIKPTKSVRSAVETAHNKLNTQMDRSKKLAEEAGEVLRFTEPKTDLDSGIVFVMETTTGKQIKVPIKTGVNTPIKYTTNSEFQELGIKDLQSLKAKSGEIFKKAKNTDVGVAKKPVAKTGRIASEAMDELAEGAGLKGALQDANKGFSNIKKLDEILPASLLAEDELAVNKVAQFFRKQEIKGMSGDDLRDRIGTFANGLKEHHPKFAKEFIKKSKEIATQYELNNIAGQSFGLNLGTAKSISVMLGNTVGKAAHGVGKAVTTSKPYEFSKGLGKLTADQTKNIMKKMSESNNPGIKAAYDTLSTQLGPKGILLPAAIFSASQQQSTKEALRKLVSELGISESSASDEIPEGAQAFGGVTEFPDGAGAMMQGVPHTEIGLYDPSLDDNRDSSSNFFTPQEGGSVNTDVDSELTDGVESVARELGHKNMVMSSGRRDEEATMKILEERKNKPENRELLTGNPEKLQNLIDKMLLRGDSPDNIIYNRRNGIGKIKQELAVFYPHKAEELSQKIIEVRKSFGGFESSHMTGKKMDIPYSYFVKRYGSEAEGKRKAKEFINKLEEKGFKVIDEEDQGVNGVIDISKGSYSNERGPASMSSQEPTLDTSDNSNLQDVLSQYQSSKQVMTKANPYQALLDEFQSNSKMFKDSDIDDSEVEHVGAKIEANRDLEEVEANTPAHERIENTRKVFPELDRLHKMMASGGQKSEYLVEDIIGLIENSFYGVEKSREYINRVMEADDATTLTSLIRDMEKTHLENIMQEYKQ